MTSTDDFVTKLILREIDKRRKKIHNRDITTANVLNISEDNKVKTSLLKPLEKKKKNKKKMKKASKAGIQFETAMLPMETKKHEWYTVGNELQNEQFENQIAVIPTKEISKSKVSFETKSFF